MNKVSKNLPLIQTKFRENIWSAILLMSYKMKRKGSRTNLKCMIKNLLESLKEHPLVLKRSQWETCTCTIRDSSNILKRGRKLKVSRGRVADLAQGVDIGSLRTRRLLHLASEVLANRIPKPKWKQPQVADMRHLTMVVGLQQTWWVGELLLSTCLQVKETP